VFVADELQHARAEFGLPPALGDPAVSSTDLLLNLLIGYMRVSKADGSQTVELQRDVLLAAGVAAAHLYDDHASGRSDDRPGLASCLKALHSSRIRSIT
jgi:hypothetical protein